jgi:uncharacterized protein
VSEKLPKVANILFPRANDPPPEMNCRSLRLIQELKMLVREEAMGLSDELERLHELHERGALSDDEYTVAKAAVIRAERAEGGNAPTEQDVQQWSILLHLSQLLAYVIPPVGLAIPLVIWQYKKYEMPEIDSHGKIVANWIVSALIYTVVSGILCAVLIGIPFLLAVLVLSIVYPIIGAVKASHGEVWRYPLSINFFE